MFKVIITVFLLGSITEYGEALLYSPGNPPDAGAMMKGTAGSLKGLIGRTSGTGSGWSGIAGGFGGMAGAIGDMGGMASTFTESFGETNGRLGEKTSISGMLGARIGGTSSRAMTGMTRSMMQGTSMGVRRNEGMVNDNTGRQTAASFGSKLGMNVNRRINDNPTRMLEGIGDMGRRLGGSLVRAGGTLSSSAGTAGGVAGVGRGMIGRASGNAALRTTRGQVNGIKDVTKRGLGGGNVRRMNRAMGSITGGISGDNGGLVGGIEERLGGPGRGNGEAIRRTLRGAKLDISGGFMTNSEVMPGGMGNAGRGQGSLTDNKGTTINTMSGPRSFQFGIGGIPTGINGMGDAALQIGSIAGRLGGMPGLPFGVAGMTTGLAGDGNMAGGIGGMFTLPFGIGGMPTGMSGKGSVDRRAITSDNVPFGMDLAGGMGSMFGMFDGIASGMGRMGNNIPNAIGDMVSGIGSMVGAMGNLAGGMDSMPGSPSRAGRINVGGGGSGRSSSAISAIKRPGGVAPTKPWYGWQ